jgi:hypothetical protein
LRTKIEVLDALVVCGALTRYVTVEELLKNPLLCRMKRKTLGVRLLRLKREGLLDWKKLGKAYGYKLNIKGSRRILYFNRKYMTAAEIEQLKRARDSGSLGKDFSPKNPEAITYQVPTQRKLTFQ